MSIKHNTDAFVLRTLAIKLVRCLKFIPLNLISLIWRDILHVLQSQQLCCRQCTVFLWTSLHECRTGVHDVDKHPT